MIKDYSTHIKEQQVSSEQTFEQIEEFIINDIFKKLENDRNPIFKIHLEIYKKIVNKKIEYTDGNNKILILVREVFMKTSIKNVEGGHLIHRFIVIDKQGNTYTLPVHVPIKIYKFINRELDPYGEEDWV